MRRLWKESQQPKRDIEWTYELTAKEVVLTRRDEERDLIRDYLLGRVDDRKRLHEQARGQLDYQISRAAPALDRFQGWAVGYKRGVDEARVELQRTLRDLRKETRSARVRFWVDVVRLRGELRERRRDYESMSRRAQM